MNYCYVANGKFPSATNVLAVQGENNQLLSDQLSENHPTTSGMA